MLGLLSRTHGCLLCLRQRSCQPRHGRATFQDERPDRAEPGAAVFHAGCCVNLVDLADDGRMRVLLAEERLSAIPTSGTENVSAGQGLLAYDAGAPCKTVG